VADSAWADGGTGGGRAADESARVVSRLATPSLGVTRAGLPVRVPKAHLVPGSFPAEPGAEDAAPTRSAEEVRNRLEDYQRGVRRGRQSD
jgi:hypothetical protein